jgi:hypothetical protein
MSFDDVTAAALNVGRAQAVKILKFRSSALEHRADALRAHLRASKLDAAISRDRNHEQRRHTGGGGRLGVRSNVEKNVRTALAQKNSLPICGTCKLFRLNLSLAIIQNGFEMNE